MASAPPAVQSAPRPLVIRPAEGWSAIRLGDLWEYRELVLFLAWRDVSVRYKQTALGAAWAILQPAMTMVVFSIFFGRLARIPSDGIPYPLFAFCALLPWQLFASSVTEAGNSLVSNQTLITKVWFPRLAIPVAAVLAALVDFAIAFLLLLGMMVWYRVTPTAAVWTLPLLVALAMITALGVGLWLSALNVQYRDVRYTIPFLVQIWLFATPIAYPSSLVPEPWRVVYGLNPMAGVVEGFRWALLGTGNAPGPLLAASVAASIVILVTGLFYFTRMERTFADRV